MKKRTKHIPFEWEYYNKRLPKNSNSKTLTLDCLINDYLNKVIDKNTFLIQVKKIKVFKS